MSPLLGEHLCIVNICLGLVTVHYREFSLYKQQFTAVLNMKIVCESVKISCDWYDMGKGDS